SSVTVMTVGSYASSGSSLSLFGGGAVMPWTPQELLDNMVKAIKTDRGAIPLWKLGTAIPSPLKHFLILHQEFVTELNRLGYTRAKLQEYLYEQTRVPYEQLTPK